MTTPYWSDFVPNSTFYRILSGFHRIFATGVACRQGTLTPPDTWSRPFGTCICSTCWHQSFSELVVILPDYALRIFLGTFSILPFSDYPKHSKSRHYIWWHLFNCCPNNTSSRNYNVWLFYYLFNAPNIPMVNFTLFDFYFNHYPKRTNWRMGWISNMDHWMTFIWL